MNAALERVQPGSSTASVAEQDEDFVRLSGSKYEAIKDSLISEVLPVVDAARAAADGTIAAINLLEPSLRPASLPCYGLEFTAYKAKLSALQASAAATATTSVFTVAAICEAKKNGEEPFLADFKFIESVVSGSVRASCSSTISGKQPTIPANKWVAILAPLLAACLPTASAAYPHFAKSPKWIVLQGGQSPPTLVHLDRVLCNTDWEELVGDCNLRCLASVVSDHSPFLLDCSPTPPMHRRFHFEDYCWSAKSVGTVKHKLALSRELILKFDKAREDRVLTPHEFWLYKSLKLTYLGYASLERTIARQRARIATLKDGDANTSFFHRQCSYRRQQNRIHSLLVDGHLVTEADGMAATAYSHFDNLLGTAVDRDCTLNLAQLIDPSDSLLEMDAPFTDEEDTVKPDLMAIFHELYNCRGRGFQKLNQALLTLLPKRPDTHELGDYSPISLIHLVAKVFAKVLSLRLASRLDDLVSKSQNAFISGRSLHDNFILVRQSMRLLHQLREPRVLLKLDLAKAFDTISWPFLFEVLRQYGFSTRFLDWLAILLSSANTRVMINGDPGPPIWHRRGLRQGDPLSPQFVLAVDALGRLIKHAMELGVLQQLHQRRPVSLYADDVVLFCHPSQSDLSAVKSICTYSAELLGYK
ncbi:hypothetical protein QYE76_042673 [Lolium multiflorum]|uniref:Reverse transcriptase domain-containing protein n=1 Tax=Lolium multiflorum TaxID=4521 RepID=A0AAD8WV43_LOLMU|nr:hypothetical protein QYE76_042673 [Lolium multiflorum]